MKFPSLSRLPKHKKFNFEPRYYDPIKEEIEERTKRIKSELEQEENDGLSKGHNIRMAFERRRKEDSGISFLQAFLIILLIGGGFGYLYYGEIALYAMLVLVPIYIFIRSRKFFK